MATSRPCISGRRGGASRLTEGARGAGVKVHVLPARPSDIEDDGEFHYAVLGPKAASESGKPSAEARRFLDETSGPEKPRAPKSAGARPVLPD